MQLVCTRRKTAPDETYRFYASTPAYHVDSKSSIGTGSVFVGKVSFSGAFTGNATVVSRNGTTYVVVMLQTTGRVDDGRDVTRIIDGDDCRELLQRGGAKSKHGCECGEQESVANSEVRLHPAVGWLSAVSKVITHRGCSRLLRNLLNRYARVLRRTGRVSR